MVSAGEDGGQRVRQRAEDRLRLIGGGGLVVPGEEGGQESMGAGPDED